MGLIKEYYHNEINGVDDVDDNEYFEWLTDLQWVDEDCIDVGKEILTKV